MSRAVLMHSGRTVEPPLHIQKKFKFYDISWNVEHFFVQTCEENWEISSPELQGPRGARLKLILKSSRNEDIADSTLSFTVRRSDSDSGPETLWVNYRVFVSDPNVAAKHLGTDKLCSFNKGSESEVDIWGMSGIFDEKKNLLIKIDSFRIDCKVIIYSEGEDFGLQCSDTGIMKLSEDMLVLFESSLDFDVQVKIGNSLLQLHKTVLASRSEWFNAAIQKEIQSKGFEITTIDISNTVADTEYEGMRKILTFIYTGNLKHVLEKPSLQIYDLAYRLNIEEIKSCYTPETLHFVSTVDAQEFAFSCCIQDFNSACENKPCLLSPAFAEVCSSRTWNFHFYPRNDEETGFVAVYAETNEEIKSMNVCLEISAVNREGCNLSMTKMLRRHVDGSSMFGLDEFEYKNWITYYAIGDILNLNIKIKLSTANQSSFIRKHFIPVLYASPGLTPFNTLSLDMKAMLDQGDFYDADFQIADCCVPVHRCILAARCRVLYDMVASHDEGSPSLQGMTKTSLLVVLSFLYTGMIYEMLEEDAGHVLAAAENFKIPLLREHWLDLIASDQPRRMSPRDVKTMSIDLSIGGF